MDMQDRRERRLILGIMAYCDRRRRVDGPPVPTLLNAIRYFGYRTARPSLQVMEIVAALRGTQPRETIERAIDRPQTYDIAPPLVGLDAG